MSSYWVIGWQRHHDILPALYAAANTERERARDRGRERERETEREGERGRDHERGRKRERQRERERDDGIEFHEGMETEVSALNKKHLKNQRGEFLF